MSIRRNHLSGSNGSKAKSRLARIRDKAVQLRNQVKQSAQVFLKDGKQRSLGGNERSVLRWLLANGCTRRCPRFGWHS